MKVLLVGEYSKLHTNLKYGLEKIGIETDIANFGDGFKKFKTDIKLLQINSNKKYNIIRKYYSQYIYEKFSKYDVVQFINEAELSSYYGFQNYTGAKIAKKSKLSVLINAGCNPQYASNTQKLLPISPCKECQIYDQHNFKDYCMYKDEEEIRRQAFQLQKNVDIIVPMAYEYYICNLKGLFSKKIVAPICMPIIIKTKIDDIYKKDRKKLVVYHPLNREGFKGTHTIKNAFRILKNKYKDSVEFIIDGKMPYKKYVELVKKSDIIVDQKNFMTFGIASLMALEEGKIVITGNYRKQINCNEYEYVQDAPIFELGKNEKEMVDNISKVIGMKQDFDKIGCMGHNYVDRYFNAEKVAKQFVDLYTVGLKEKLN